MTPTLHPIPPRLKLLILPLNLHLFTIMAEREGVGLNQLLFTKRMSMCLELIQVSENRASKAPNIQPPLGPPTSRGVGEAVHCLRHISFFPEARALQDFVLELERRLGEVVGVFGVVHEPLESDLEVIGRPVARVIDEENRTRRSRDVDGRCRD